MNKTSTRLDSNNAIPVNHQLKKNNLMSEKGDLQSDTSDKQESNKQHDRERRLSQIANSVSGFYKDNGSDHSLMRSTHESNFA